MEISDLRSIITIAEEGSISKASQKLYISQSHLSRTLKKIETTLDITIFVRDNRGVELTNEGVEFINYAKNILVHANKLKLIKDDGKQHKKKISISTIRSDFAINALLNTINSSNKLEVYFNETGGSQPVDDVYYLNADIGIIYTSKDHKSDLLKELRKRSMSYRKLKDVKTYLKVRNNHPLLKKWKKEKELKIQDLYNFGLVRYNNNILSSYSKNLDLNLYNIFLNLNRINNIVYVNDRHSMNTILRNSDYFAIGTKGCKKYHHCEKIQFIDMFSSMDLNIFEMGIVYHEDLPFTRSIVEFIQDLELTCKKLED